MYLNFEFPPLLYYMRSNPDTFLPGTKHMSRNNIDFFDLLVVFEGCLHLWEDGVTYDIHQGEFLILEPNKKHYGYKASDKKTHYYWLHFQAEGSYYETKDEPKVLTIDTHKHILTIPKFAQLQNTHIIYKQFKELSNLHTYSNSLLKHQQQIIFLQLIQQLMNNDKNSQESPQVIQIAKDTIRFLEENFTQEITYEILSENLKFNSTYITRCLKKVYNCTPLDYLKKVRLEEAKFNLIHTDFTIEKIAILVGFNSTSYFSRTFSNEYGISPLQYRKIYHDQNSDPIK